LRAPFALEQDDQPAIIDPQLRTDTGQFIWIQTESMSDQRAVQRRETGGWKSKKYHNRAKRPIPERWNSRSWEFQPYKNQADLQIAEPFRVCNVFLLTAKGYAVPTRGPIGRIPQQIPL
jgi:hypothetical protein